MSCSPSARSVVAALLAAVVALPAAAEAAGPRVTVSVIGPGGAVVRAPRVVGARDARLRVERRFCVVPGATPLAALAQLRLPLRITAGGSCSPSAYFVTTIAGRANRGRDGWAYKVGRRAGTASAADTAGSFGTGRRLRSGEVVTWFWCELGRRGCQRTLGARRSGSRSVVVHGYDDRGRGVRVARALVTVRAGRRVARARTDRRGVARLPALRGSWQITARRGGYVPALPGGAR